MAIATFPAKESSYMGRIVHALRNIPQPTTERNERKPPPQPTYLYSLLLVLLVPVVHQSPGYLLYDRYGANWWHSRTSHQGKFLLRILTKIKTRKSLQILKVLHQESRQLGKVNYRVGSLPVLNVLHQGCSQFENICSGVGSLQVASLKLLQLREVKSIESSLKFLKVLKTITWFYYTIHPRIFREDQD